MRFFIFISMYSVIIPITIGVIQFKKTQPFLILLLFYVLSSFTADIICSMDYSLNRITHIVFTAIQSTTFLSIFFIATHNQKIKKLAIWFWLFLVLFAIYSHVFINLELREVSYIFDTTNAISFIIISLFVLYDLYKNPLHKSINSTPVFWAAIGIFIYFSGNILYYLSRNIFSVEEVYMLHFPIHNTLNALKNILFAIAFYIQLKQFKNKPSLSTDQ